MTRRRPSERRFGLTAQLARHPRKADERKDGIVKKFPFQDWSGAAAFSCSKTL